MGLIHNDLNPTNIFIDVDPLIIDCDSCMRQRDKLGSKGGNFGWSLEDEDYARRDNDSYSLGLGRGQIAMSKSFIPNQVTPTPTDE